MKLQKEEKMLITEDGSKIMGVKFEKIFVFELPSGDLLDSFLLEEENCKMERGNGNVIRDTVEIWKDEQGVLFLEVERKIHNRNHSPLISLKKLIISDDRKAHASSFLSKIVEIYKRRLELIETILPKAEVEKDGEE